ncbi:unnamed protein product [Brachionus calyciflorus]|uniref:Uncharacterized protein n=1 Tax=Brachionus calyciflorus TaxID=104777 RepID=A0A813M4P8_9BILA|nr:unnamed protein product [Brachionus calyciflorus]
MNFIKFVDKKCQCNLINRIGPPPIYLLEPPPMPPLPIEFENLIISNTQNFEKFLKCPIKNQTAITNDNLLISNFTMNNSYLVIVIVIIVILIVLLILFILFAFIIVYITRLKLSRKNENLNQSKNSSTTKHESQQTVSVLTLTSPSFTQLTNSPNSTQSYAESFEEKNNLIFENPKKIPLNSFSKLPLHENTFKPIQNNFNNMSSSVSSSCSSASPNKQSISNDSIETSRTNSTILTQGTRPIRVQKRNLPNENQHYYESIGDISQLYFDVDDQSMYKKNLSRFIIPESVPVNSYQVNLDFDKQHYPITCCSCTLMKFNNQSINHMCRSNFDRNQNGNSQLNLSNNVKYLTQSNINSSQSGSNLNSSNFLKSLIV